MLARHEATAVAIWCICALLLAAELPEASLAVEIRGCDQERSREANDIIRDVVLNAVEKSGYELPETCMFHPVRDLLHPIESTVTTYRSKFRCAICKLTDRSRESIYEHVVQAHSYLIDDHGGDVCLADYCNMLECPAVKREMLQYRAGSACSDTEMQRRRFDCASIIQSCFPPSASATAQELHSAFDRIFCRRQRCGYVEPTNEFHAELYERYVTAAEGSLWFWIKAGLFVTALVLISVYYIAMWLWKKELQMEDDLKRLSQQRRSRLTRMFSKPKVKGY